MCYLWRNAGRSSERGVPGGQHRDRQGTWPGTMDGTKRVGDRVTSATTVSRKEGSDRRWAGIGEVRSYQCRAKGYLRRGKTTTGGRPGVTLFWLTGAEKGV